MVIYVLMCLEEIARHHLDLQEYIIVIVISIVVVISTFFVRQHKKKIKVH